MTDVIYHVFRLEPGQDLKQEIQAFVRAKGISAGWICTCVGSLTEYAIRFANQQVAATATGYFEILTLTGTLSVNGIHLHICLGNSLGETIGGHLGFGNIIFTTAEIVLAESSSISFERNHDDRSGYKELSVKPMGD